MNQDGPVRVLFLGGLGRSGSTLIERLVAELPGTMSLGEVVHLWERGVGAGESCGCRQSFRECPFWTEVGEIAFGGWDGFDLDRFRALRDPVDRIRHIPTLSRRELSGDLRETLDAYVDHYLRLYEAVRQVTGAGLLVDSSKHASLAFCLRWASLAGRLDLRVAHIVRDSRGVALSWAKQVRRPEAAAGGEEWMAQWSPGKVALHWNAENGAFGLLGRRGVPVETVRYERFMADPRASLRRIAEFAGVPADDEALSFLSDDRAVLSENHTASGNPMRFKTGPIELRRDDHWRTRMEPAHRRTVTALTLPLLRHYGYV
ncbi:sulfotransferase domain-containing protein [Actinomadura sp. 9N407]|uniref:sulfotransferase domain-containing protein n=1 Tax=Actinomadura sp. 9N407 TaxID=3375154 RepID=UPI0037A01718